MKLSKTFPLALFALVFLANNLAAQKHLDVNLAHNWNLLDRDIEFSVERFLGKTGIKAGLNLFQHTAQESLTWERPYAANFGQKIGFHAAFLYRAPLRHSDVELSPYFKVAAFYLSDKRKLGENEAIVSDAYFRPSTSLGLQAKARLSGRLMLFGSVEVGAVWAFGNTPNFFPGQYFYGGATGGSVGLGWRLKK